jgi:hypothetical protein
MSALTDNAVLGRLDDADISKNDKEQTAKKNGKP